MKLFVRILLIVIILVLVSVAALAVWQKDNIRSIINSFRYSDEELQKKIDENKKKVEELVESITRSKIRDFTLEEEERIRKGEITPQEALEKVVAEGLPKQEQPDESKANTAQDGSSSLSYKNDNANSVNDIISSHITQMYHLKATYVGKLGDLERRAIADYKALSAGKKGGAAGKQAIVSKYLGEAANLEKECDAQVNAVLSSLKAELKKHNHDLEIIGVIRKAYEDEKVLKKSYYINMYK
ncbi:MAG: hypothetical protein PHF89_05580 [Eubacteriales bacterium]|jgi:hypothetical protein|nr:hypothetical protein [Eubacteriales bacterium]